MLMDRALLMLYYPHAVRRLLREPKYPPLIAQRVLFPCVLVPHNALDWPGIQKMFERPVVANKVLPTLSGSVGDLQELINQGEGFLAGSDIQQALKAFTAALILAEQPPFKGTSAHQGVLKAVGELSCITGDYARAEHYLLNFLALDATSQASVSVRMTLGHVYFSVGKLEQVLVLLQPAITIACEATGTDYDPVILADARWLQALAYRDSGQVEDAADSCLEALEIFTEVYGASHPRTLLCHCSLDHMLISFGDLSSAAVSLPYILKELRRQLEVGNIDLATPLVANARLACAVAKKLGSMRESCSGRQSPHNKESVLDLLGSYGLGGRAGQIFKGYGGWIPNEDLQVVFRRLERKLLTRAKVHLQEALGIFKARLSADHPDNADILDNLGAVCGCLNQRDEQEWYQSEADKLRALNRSRMEL
jgi:tetratricopeptide (TPR) repeat protein